MHGEGTDEAQEERLLQQLLGHHSRRFEVRTLKVSCILLRTEAVSGEDFGRVSGAAAKPCEAEPIQEKLAFATSPQVPPQKGQCRRNFVLGVGESDRVEKRSEKGFCRFAPVGVGKGIYPPGTTPCRGSFAFNRFS